MWVIKRVATIQEILTIYTNLYFWVPSNRFSILLLVFRFRIELKFLTTDKLVEMKENALFELISK